MTRKTVRHGIAHWPASERPRERLLAQGADALTDAQLLAILLRVGRQRSSAVKVSMEVLDRLGGVAGLRPLRYRGTVCRRGSRGGEGRAGQSRAGTGQAVVGVPAVDGHENLLEPRLFEHYHPALRNLRHEIFKVVLLDAKNAILRDVTVSEGSLTLSIVHPREVFMMAVKESAAAVIFLHNHPSGDPTPSQEDHVPHRTVGVCGVRSGDSSAGPSRCGRWAICQFCR